MLNKKIVKHSFITLSLSLVIQLIGSILFVLKFPDITIDQLYSSPYIFGLYSIWNEYWNWKYCFNYLGNIMFDIVKK